MLPVCPAVIIATEDDGKLNFASHGQIGTVCAEPSVIYVSVIKEHKTAKNILKNKTFSVNVPPAGLADKLRRCGSVSGNDTDKSSEFEVFYGNVNVPMIKSCPVTFACKVIKTKEINGFLMFLAEVTETYSDDDCLSIYEQFEFPDAGKIMPILCSMDGSYRTVSSEKIK